MIPINVLSIKAKSNDFNISIMSLINAHSRFFVKGLYDINRCPMNKLEHLSNEFFHRLLKEKLMGD